MKKKAIEKVPFLKLPKVNKKKKTEYVAVTAVKEIREEPHLFMEVYRNRKECREIPVVRIAMTEKDFGTYFTETGTWSRGRITKNTWSDYGLIWQEDDERLSKTVAIMAEENIIYSPEDLKRIQDFTKVKIWNESPLDTPYWRLVQNGVTVSEGKILGKIENGSCLVVDSNPSRLEIAEYDLLERFVKDRYEDSDFDTRRFIYLPPGSSRLKISHAGTANVKFLVEVMEFAG